MTIYKDYKIAVFLNEKDLKLNKCVVRFRAKKGNSFKVNLKELLMLTPGKSILSKDKRVVLKHISLDKVAITDGDNRVTYTDFHTVREWVRRKLLSVTGYEEQIEEVNRLIFTEELLAYLNHGLGESYGFKLYMEERFPEETKEKYGNDAYRLFWDYRNVLESDYVPGKIIHYEKKDFRTKENSRGEYYTYPIINHYYKKEVSFKMKAFVCTMLELKLEA